MTDAFSADPEFTDPRETQAQRESRELDETLALYAEVFGSYAGKRMLRLLRTKCRADNGELEDFMRGPHDPLKAVAEATLHTFYWYIHNMTEIGLGRGKDTG